MRSLFSPEKVEKELHKLQMEASPYGARATLFNLVVFTRQESQQQAEQIYSDMFGKRTARIIHINRVDSDSSEVFVSARCLEDNDGKAVCFQEVLIECGRDEYGVSAGAWTPLLLREIPVYILWLDKVIGNEDIIAEAAEHADKIIFDSDFICKKNGPVGELLRVYLEQVSEAGVLLADLSWKRGLPLRKLTAWAFNHEKSLPLLDKVISIRIEGGGCATVQLYLLWLSERLDWDIAGADFLTPNGRSIKAEHHNPDSLDTGIEIRMELEGGEEIILSGGPSGCGEIDIPRVRTLPRVFTTASSGQLLQEETDYLYGDRVYQLALKRLYAQH
ncbi:MAG: glucose-6-phosphate dehydrogenase assembly protein OpcA [Spirochaeta sp.]